MKKKKILVTILIISVLWIIYKCDTSNSNEKTTTETTSETTSEPTKETEKFKPGEIGYLTDNCIGVVNYDDMTKVMEFLNADDMTGIKQMVAAGQATTFASGKRVKVIKSKWGNLQVRDIDATERLVWIPKGMLTHEDVWGIYKDE